MAKEKCLKKLAERRQVVPGQEAECKREFIPSGGANNREIINNDHYDITVVSNAPFHRLKDKTTVQFDVTYYRGGGSFTCQFLFMKLN